MKTSVFINAFISMSLLLSGCYALENKIDSNTYSIEDIRVNVADTKIYTKSNNQLTTGQIILKNDDNYLYYEINEGLITEVKRKARKAQDFDNFFLKYDNKKLTHFFLQDIKSQSEIKLRNHNLIYFESVSKPLTVRLEIDQNNEVKNFLFNDLKHHQSIIIKNNEVKYFKLPDNELLKSTDFSKDLIAQKMINNFKNVLEKSPFKHFTYKTQIATLYSESKSSISIKECQNLLGQKAYDRLFEVYQSKEAVFMQCKNRAFGSI